MNNGLSQSARNVQEALASLGVDCQVVELSDSTRTAREAAAAIGCGVEQIVKSLVFRGKQSDRGILVIASGSNRVNEKILAVLAGEPVEKADADFVREKTGYAIGGVPPLAHRFPLLTFIDQDLLNYGKIWAAAGTPYSVFSLTPADLQLMTDGQVVKIN